MRKILNVFGGLGILALTTNSVVSCNLFELEATPSENKDDREERPWWFPEKVTNQHGLEQSVDDNSIDLWKIITIITQWLAQLWSHILIIYLIDQIADSFILKTTMTFVKSSTKKS
ncbi:hypothetical protein SCLARK_001879 [Spiroplasma clarkii]|uniref:hypothetical protein n=1 Tax=Spiroplasma clarkii TaxID=2139 RepID=UPI000B582039|nr:hypothetical protein [Spiroplasma clarkii]ARU92309.1 hypothetical protein SCLARK_001879 [Spiroplasma clarkii]